MVIDRPNIPDQSTGTKQATAITRDILTEVLPYMGIFMTEDLSEKELAELEQKKLEDTRRYTQTVSGGDGAQDGDAQTDGGGQDDTTAPTRPPWMDFERDPATGYLKDPETGQLIDPETGDAIGGNYGAIQE